MPDQKRKKGFTLIEVIATLIVISILAVVVFSRMTSSADANLKAKAEALKGHIRYVQMHAIYADPANPTTCSASFGISMTGNSYFMFRDCDKTKKVILPGATATDIPLTTSTLDIYFDKWGSPCSYLNPNTTPYNADQTITVATETITITKNTGYVP